MHQHSFKGARMRARLAGLLLALLAAPAVRAESLRFSVSYDPSITDSYTGRVYVLCSRGSRMEPRFGPHWFSDEPFIATDVQDWKPEQPLVISTDNALSYPVPIDEIPQDTWSVQAVLRLNPDSPHLGRAGGNAYGPMHQATFGGADGGTIELTVDRLAEAQPFGENERLRLMEMRSEKLSAFHGRDVIMRASVYLPPEAQDPEARFATIYTIPGFGSDHNLAYRMMRFWLPSGYNKHFARVVLDPTCFGGHHVFADSANNGPWGTALVQEFIPWLESQLPVIAEPTARFLWGHSSGGWSSLWLQITHPDFFGGVWSTAPDPVDFSSFQLADLYAQDANLFVDAGGSDLPIAQQDGMPLATTRQFSRMEEVYGEGGQLRSFEWVFSPRGADGLPMRLYDRSTGAIDPAVAEAWKAYDIRYVLDRDWSTLGPRLQGKLHVFVGDQDTFFLHRAVIKLKATLQELGSDAVVEIHENKDHGTLMSRELMGRIDGEAFEAFRRAHPREELTTEGH